MGQVWYIQGFDYGTTIVETFGTATYGTFLQNGTQTVLVGQGRFGGGTGNACEFSGTNSYLGVFTPNAPGTPSTDTWLVMAAFKIATAGDATLFKLQRSGTDIVEVRVHSDGRLAVWAQTRLVWETQAGAFTFGTAWNHVSWRIKPESGDNGRTGMRLNGVPIMDEDPPRLILDTDATGLSTGITHILYGNASANATTVVVDDVYMEYDVGGSSPVQFHGEIWVEYLPWTSFTNAAPPSGLSSPAQPWGRTGGTDYYDAVETVDGSSSYLTSSTSGSFPATTITYSRAGFSRRDSAVAEQSLCEWLTAVAQRPNGSAPNINLGHSGYNQVSLTPLAVGAYWQTSNWVYFLGNDDTAFNASLYAYAYDCTSNVASYLSSFILIVPHYQNVSPPTAPPGWRNAPAYQTYTHGGGAGATPPTPTKTFDVTGTYNLQTWEVANWYRRGFMHGWGDKYAALAVNRYKTLVALSPDWSAAGFVGGDADTNLYHHPNGYHNPNYETYDDLRPGPHGVFFTFEGVHPDRVSAVASMTLRVRCRAPAGNQDFDLVWGEPYGPFGPFTAAGNYPPLILRTVTATSTWQEFTATLTEYPKPGSERPWSPYDLSSAYTFTYGHPGYLIYPGYFGIFGRQQGGGNPVEVAGVWLEVVYTKVAAPASPASDNTWVQPSGDGMMFAFCDGFDHVQTADVGGTESEPIGNNGPYNFGLSSNYNFVVKPGTGVSYSTYGKVDPAYSLHARNSKWPTKFGTVTVVRPGFDGYGGSVRITGSHSSIDRALYDVSSLGNLFDNGLWGFRFKTADPSTWGTGVTHLRLLSVYTAAAAGDWPYNLVFTLEVRNDGRLVVNRVDGELDDMPGPSFVSSAAIADVTAWNYVEVNVIQDHNLNGWSGTLPHGEVHLAINGTPAGNWVGYRTQLDYGWARATIRQSNLGYVKLGGDSWNPGQTHAVATDFDDYYEGVRGTWNNYFKPWQWMGDVRIGVVYPTGVNGVYLKQFSPSFDLYPTTDPGLPVTGATNYGTAIGAAHDKPFTDDAASRIGGLATGTGFDTYYFDLTWEAAAARVPGGEIAWFQFVGSTRDPSLNDSLQAGTASWDFWKANGNLMHWYYQYVPAWGGPSIYEGDVYPNQFRGHNAFRWDLSDPFQIDGSNDIRSVVGFTTAEFDALRKGFKFRRSPDDSSTIQFTTLLVETIGVAGTAVAPQVWVQIVG